MEVEITKTVYHKEVIDIDFPYYYYRKDMDQYHGGFINYGKITEDHIVYIEFFCDNSEVPDAVEYGKDSYSPLTLGMSLENSERITESEFQNAKLIAWNLIEKE